MMVGVNAAIEKSFSKFVSDEHKMGLSFQHDILPYLTFRLEGCKRTNQFDKYASMEALKNEMMPSFKQSLILELGQRWTNSLLNGFLEFGIPSAAPNFIKLGANYSRQFLFMDERFKLGCDFFGGIVRPLSLVNPYLHINDRFFLNNEYGFDYLSHTTPSSRVSTPGKGSAWTPS